MEEKSGVKSEGRLTGRQRKHLRSRAHSLRPVAQVGKNGLTEELLAHLDRELAQLELIKLRFVDFKEEKREVCAEIESRLGCVNAGLVGHVAILYRAAAEPADRRIELPS